MATPNNLLIKHYAGSLAYGTNLPTSDVDFRGIFVAEPISIRTPFFNVKEVSDSSEEDTVYYELSQFMKLALDCNPNVVETLWVDRHDIVQTSDAYELLRAAAPKLLTSKIAFTTSGYALAQLKRIKGHNKWINQPQPVDQPQMADYMTLVQNFTPVQSLKLKFREVQSGYKLIPYGNDIYGVYKQDNAETFNLQNGALNEAYSDDQLASVRKDLTINDLHYIFKYNRDVHVTAKETWQNYWTWKKNRNEKRSALEEQFGYDTKHAMHLVRLLRMGQEALETGQLIVKRPDAQELLAIRNGSMTYEEIVEYAEHMDDNIRNVLYPKTSLAKKPDLHFAAKLMMDVQDSIWTK